MVPYEWLCEARERIRPYIMHTPLTFDPELNLYLKWENRQVTGSFKARGALNKLISLPAQERTKGVVAASAGNHGQGLALAGKITGTSTIVFVPSRTPKIKLNAMKELGAEIHLINGGYIDAEEQGAQYASDTGAIWVSPYNDAEVIAGQGTIALEIFEELSHINKASWIVPASGGGLLAGIAVSLESSKSMAELIAVQSDTSAFLYAIYHYGNQDGVIELPTIAEGLAGAVEQRSITIPIIKNRVDQFLLVSETSIKKAIAFCWRKYNEIIEGAAAVTMAAILEGQVKARPAILIISGGNIQPEMHQHIISRY